MKNKMRTNKKKKIKFIPLPKTKNIMALDNPYCGFYSIYRFFAESTIRFDDDSKLEDIKLNSNRLCQIQINLIKFNEDSIEEEALNNIKTILEFFISHNKQIIIRFVYDWIGKGIVSEPKDISIILKHMEQLSIILKTYEKDIYIIQGLFIGSWGEMHNSRYLSEHHIITLFNKLYESTGSKTQIALRSPSFIRMILKSNKPLDEGDISSNGKKSRLSLFNDAIMASETDLGTYGDVKEKESKSYSDKWIREDELEYQNKHCNYVSNGGEVILVGGIELANKETTIEVLKKMRISYLHDEYDKKVLEAWKETKLDSSFKEYKGISLYDYISTRLGYRYMLEDVKLIKKPKEKNKILIGINMINRGFSPSYHQFCVKIIIRDIDYKEAYEYEIDTNTRYWYPEEVINIYQEIDVSDFNNNTYLLGIQIYDHRTNRYIEISNTFSNIDYKGYYNIGNIIIKD